MRCGDAGATMLFVLDEWRIFLKFKMKTKLCISVQQYPFVKMVHGRKDFEIQKAVKKRVD